MTSVVHAEDIVCRASRGTILDLIENIHRVKDYYGGDLVSATTRHFFDVILNGSGEGVEVTRDEEIRVSDSKSFYNALCKEDDVEDDEEDVKKDAEADRTLLPVVQKKQPNLDFSNQQPKLYLAGTIFHIVREGTRYSLYRSSRERFTEVILEANIFSDHLTYKYHNALQELGHTLSSQELPSKNLTLFSLVKYSVILSGVVSIIVWIVSRERRSGTGAFSPGLRFWSQFCGRVGQVLRDVAMEMFGRISVNLFSLYQIP